MDVFLDSLNGISLYGCTESSCVAGFEPNSFVLELRSNVDVFNRYSYRVQKLYFDDGYTINTLEFELIVVLESRNAAGIASQSKLYNIQVELSMY